jgi:hypothetical protein
MQTVELPPSSWSRAFAEFSALHEGWLVSVDVLAPALGAQHEFHDLPLVGVVSEPRDRGNLITIAAGAMDGQQITHAVHSPLRVWLEKTNDGADAAMQIESADGIKTILRLKTPARPETVDGVARG